MKLTQRIKVLVIVVFLSVLNSCGPGGANEDNKLLVFEYDVNTIEGDDMLKMEFYHEDTHFLTMTNTNGVLEICPHPGTSQTDSGSIWFAQPYFSGAILGHTITTIPSVYQNGINFKSIGKISQEANQGAGFWSIELLFSYDKDLHQISASGKMVISVTDDILYDHVFLYKIKSLFLNDIVLLPLDHQPASTKNTGDTGWIEKLIVNNTDEWLPDQQSTLEIMNMEDRVHFQLLGDYFHPDTSAYGYESIVPSYTPGIDISARSENTLMGYVCNYDLDHQQEIGSTNIEIAPMISLEPGKNNYTISIEFSSRSIEHLNGKSQKNSGKSCAYIQNKNLSWGDGIYWVDLDHNKNTLPVQVYCDMTDDGGGWMLYASINEPQEIAQIRSVDYQQGALSPNLDNIDTGNWILPASQFDGYIQVMRLNMGAVKDFFKPHPGTSFESMLINPDRHLWHSSPSGLFTQPKYADTGLGGSELLWPRNNVENDNRMSLSFWGSDNSGGSGGCCSLSHTNTDHQWGRAFKLWVR